MNNLRQINVILYQLKKNFGVAIDLRNRISSEVNRKTGNISKDYDVIPIRRAIVLPARVTPAFVYGLLPSNFKYGGFFGSHLRNVIVDGNDLSDGFLIKEKTEALFENAIHVLKDFFPTAENRGFILSLSTLSNTEIE